MNCIHCNKPLNRGSKFCSQKCYQDFKKAIFDLKYTKRCTICGKDFRCPSTAPRKKTCSIECKRILNTQKTWKEETNKKRAETLIAFYSTHEKKGYKLSEKSKLKIRESCKGINKGSKNGNWRDGASKNIFRGDD
jgi:predicted nucleic acid-binding Zn ribbon protein